jgi:hypothetical protein
MKTTSKRTLGTAASSKKDGKSNARVFFVIGSRYAFNGYYGF